MEVEEQQTPGRPGMLHRMCESKRLIPKNLVLSICCTPGKLNHLQILQM